MHYGDLVDSGSLTKILSKVKPNEIYHLGAQSHVGTSFEIPEYTLEATGYGTLKLLEAIRNLKIYPKIYQAGSSEMYGNFSANKLNENSSFHPRSPYAAAKVYAHWIAVNYREHTICLFQTEYYLIMNHQIEVKILLQGKLLLVLL